MRPSYIVICFLLAGAAISAQVKLKGLGDKLRELSPMNKMDKMRENYDESNFNYAISFLDNSALFESEEKGNSLATGFTTGLTTNGSNSGENLAYNNMRQGEMLMAANRMYMAEVAFKRSAEYYIRAEKMKGNTTYAQVVSNLGLVYQNKGLYAKAMPFCDSAIALRKAMDNKVMIAVSLNNKGVLLKDMGSYTEAETYIKNAHKILVEQKDELGKALTSNNLAMVYVDMNKLKDAELNMDSAIAMAGRVLDRNSSNFIKIDSNLAQVYRLQKKIR